MRILLMTLLVLGLTGLGAVGGVSILIGIAEQHAADQTYVVGFSHPGAECGSGAVSFDVTNGEPLSCVPAGVLPMSDKTNFPGFTDAQNDEVTVLAKQLGTDRLSTADRQQIQRRVDQISATVPAARRPHYDEGVSLGPLWGAGLAWVGAAALATSALVIVLVLRRSSSGSRSGGTGSSRR